MPVRRTTRGALAVSLLAAVAAIAGSYAVTGDTPDFVVAPGGQ